MKTDFLPSHGMDLDENGEWVEVPLENVMPASLYESLCAEDEDMDGAIVIPFLQEEFKKWLINIRNLTADYAKDYLRNYESAYGRMVDEVGVDLYGLLRSFIYQIPHDTSSDLTKDFAPCLVDIYLEEMQESLDQDEKSFTKKELRAFNAYRDFITDYTNSDEPKLLKDKTTPLPDEEEFLNWLQAEYRMDYTRALKIVSSVKNMELIVPSRVTEITSFLEVLRALPKEKRENYLTFVKEKRNRIFERANCKPKTIQNGFTNIGFYIKFLNSK